MGNNSLLKNPLIFALDVDEESLAWTLVEETAGLVGAIKVGPRLILRYGPDLLRRISKVAPVFVDMKFFDIPSTMVSAVRSTFDMGATLVTVHAQAGIEALTKLAELESEYLKTNPVQILAVTILTSFNSSTLPGILKEQPIDEHVLNLIELGRQSGLRGFVCSPQELAKIPNRKDLYLVTPGIRTQPSIFKEDQKRVMNPSDAIRAGASAIVVGRPILEAESPAKMCEDILVSLRSANTF